MNPNWAIAAGLIVISGAIFIALRVSRANRLVRHEVGPDALRLLQELDTHLAQTVARDPELAAGFQRLRTALDETRKETP